MLSKHFLSSLILFCYSITNLSGQHIDSNYNIKVLGTSFHQLSIDTEGNAFIFGGFHDYHGKNLGRIVKIGPDGNLLPFESLYADAAVSKIKILPSGKILISGNFSRINNIPVHQLLRLNQDGTIDNTFVSALHEVQDFDVQSDGKIIVVSDRRFHRLLNDGSLDQTFSSDVDLFASIKFCMGLDGSIYFSMLGTVNKITPAGSIDQTFVIGTEQHGIMMMQTQSDGKILIGGNFTHYNNYASRSIVRIDTNGEVDPTFQAVGANSSISAVLERSNHHLVVAGNFNVYNNSVTNLVELNSDGTFFKPIAYLTLNVVSSIAGSGDGKITIAGEFHSVMDNERYGIARFNEDYSLDLSFTPLITFNDPNSRSLQVQGDGSLFVGGDGGFFGVFDGQDKVVGRILNVDQQGNVNTGFVPFFTSSNNYGTIYSHLVLSDNKVVVSGFFGNGWQVIRLNDDGSKDGTFADGLPAIPPQVIVKYGDELLLGGSYTSYNGIPATGLVAITTDGFFVRTYNALPANSSIYRIGIQLDGKLVLLGNFPFNSGIKSLIRLNTDGELDETFNSLRFNGNYSDLAIDSSDNIYVAGATLNPGTDLVKYIAKFGADGNLDTSFHPGKGINGFAHIQSIGILPDNKIAIGGSFNEIFGYQSPGFAILDSNGNYIFSPQPIFGKGTRVSNMVFRNDELFLSGNLVRGDYRETYGIQKILLKDISAPLRPTDLSAEVSKGIASISWTDNSNNELVFVLEKMTSEAEGFIPVDTLPFNTSEAKILLEPNTNTTFRLRSFNYAGFSSYSDVANATWYPIPEGVITLTNSIPSESKIRLTWSFLLEHHDGFVIQRLDGHAPDFQTLDTLLSDAVTYEDSIQRNFFYRYRIGTFNNNGIIFSNEVVIEWTPLPDGNLSVSVDLVEEATAQVHWAGSIRYHDGYIIQRKIEDFEFVTIDTVAAGIFAFAEEIEMDQQLIYRIKPFNTNGSVSFESPIFQWSPEPEGEISLLVDLNPAFPGPLLTWTSDVNYHKVFIVESSTNSEADFLPVDTLAADVFSFSDTQNGRAGSYYRVGAYNAHGRIYSNTVQFLITDLSRSPKEEITIFPIPSKRYVRINSPKHSVPNEYSLKTTEGKSVWVPMEVSGNQVVFDLEELPEGVYFLQYYDANKMFHNRRIVKY